MAQSKPFTNLGADIANLEDQKRTALQYLLEAWDQALSEGVEPDLVATSAIFTALSDMVDIYGEEPVAQMAEGLPMRIRAGEFTLHDTEH